MQLAELAGHSLGTRRVDYTPRDTILYNLAIGVSSEQLVFVYERDLRAIPTYACALGLWAVEAAGELGAYDRDRSLHVGQSLTIHEPLPTSGRLEMTGRVSAAWDKGTATLVEVEVEAEPFTAGYTLFLAGIGDWGGQRGSRALPSQQWESAATTEFKTADNLAAWYRLTGDLHPIHVDPEVAAANGFDRPILHGLCSLGIAVREVAESLGRSAADVGSVTARLAAPVVPGDALTVERAALGGENATVRFRARVGATDVITDGVVGLREPVNG